MYRLLVCTVFMLLALTAPVAAQNSPAVTVGFVADQTINSASAADEGAAGISRLNQIFLSLGAKTETISLNEPIPETIKVVVIVGPQRPLPADYAARLWTHLQGGNHLLLAIDPANYAGVQEFNLGAGVLDSLNGLLTQDYGLGSSRSFLAESWFTVTTLADLNSSASQIYAENIVPNPVLSPLLHYQLPVQTWASTQINVAALGINSRAYPLLYSESVFGEASRYVFPLPRVGEADLSPLEYNVEADYQGHLLVGGLGQNTKTNSRVALLGDSEMLQNGFGLALEMDHPQHPGNYLLAQRLAAWLLALPEAQWPETIPGFTWLALDGSATDWADNIPTTESAAMSAKAFYNNDYLYLFIQPQTPLDEPVQVELTISQDGQPGAKTTIRLSANEGVSLTTASGSQSVQDGAISSGEGIEIRLPLRVTGLFPVIDQVCLGVGATNCLDQTLTPAAVAAFDPLPLRFPPGPWAIVNSISPVNVRSNPDENFPVLGVAANRTQFTIIGRNSDSEWIQVQNSRYRGWISAARLYLTTNVERLPVSAD